MSFEEEFPSLKGQDGEEGFFCQDVIRAGCLDKERVKKAIERGIKIFHKEHPVAKHAGEEQFKWLKEELGL